MSSESLQIQLLTILNCFLKKSLVKKRVFTPFVLESKNGSPLKYVFRDNTFLKQTGDILYTYIPLMLYPQRGSRDITDIPPRDPLFTKMT
jgi:hypothetical protein